MLPGRLLLMSKNNVKTDLVGSCYLLWLEALAPWHLLVLLLVRSSRTALSGHAVRVNIARGHFHVSRSFSTSTADRTPAIFLGMRSQPLDSILLSQGVLQSGLELFRLKLTVDDIIGHLSGKLCLHCVD